jgi:hypothetical protein
VEIVWQRCRRQRHHRPQGGNATYCSCTPGAEAQVATIGCNIIIEQHNTSAVACAIVIIRIQHHMQLTAATCIAYCLIHNNRVGGIQGQGDIRIARCFGDGAADGDIADLGPAAIRCDSNTCPALQFTCNSSGIYR